MNEITHTAKPSLGQVLFKLEHISKLYPGTIALNDVNLDILAGECHGIIGKNGAGKTTLVKIISGVIPPSKGTITINGEPCSNLSRTRARNMGISIVTQEPQIIPEFTVAENLSFPTYSCTTGKKILWPDIYKIASDALAKAGFNMPIKRMGRDLSTSEQQLLLVIKAFFVDKNNIVILDEVTTALSRKDQTYLFNLLDAQKRQGKAIVFISHRMSEIIRICERITVLRDSRVIASQEKQDMDETGLSKLIVGQTAGDEPEEKIEQKRFTNAGTDPILDIENLTLAGRFNNINLTLNQGEIVGLAGLRGSGRTDLMKTISGVFKPDKGKVSLHGQDVRFKHPKDAFHAGIAYLPEDRDLEGLVDILSVKHNITLSCLSKFTRKSLIDKAGERRAARRMVKALDIKVSTFEQEVKTLSGGNRQKVVIARLMTARPSVFLLDEPTKGIDIGAKNAILGTVRNELSQSGGIIITSPSVEDLMRVCDRIMVLYNGRIIESFNQEDFNLNQIYLALQGVMHTSKEEL